MAQIKFNISQKDGKTVQKELSEEQSVLFMDKKVGDSISGDPLGFQGYEFTITGGSDKSGLPMRSDNPGSSRRRILTVPGTIGVKKGRKGMKRRKLVAGNTISETTVQVNAKVTKAGKGPLVEPPQEENAGEGAEGSEAPKQEA